MKHFSELGAGSVVDAEYRVFMYDNSFGSGLGLRLAAVSLVDFVKYTGGGGNSLKGETLEDDGLVTESAAAKDDEFAEAIEDFNEALKDEDKDDAKDALGDLKEHPEYKQFKKQFKKAFK